jgi:hypothetical protein
MVNIFTPKKDADEQIFFPFGPVMGYKKLSPEFVKNMNSFYEEEPDLQDYSDNLVGKVGQELHFNEAMRDLFLNEVKDFIGRYNQTATIRNSYGRNRLNTDNFEYSMQFVSGWLVRQFQHEYNPVHLHTGCRMSCVGYLKLPEGIEKEWEEDYKDHHPSHGHIQFISGSAGSYSATNFMVRPQVGDFYVFPSELFHCVYPFYTKGERRSFSSNFNFVEIPKGEKSETDS